MSLVFLNSEAQTFKEKWELNLGSNILASPEVSGQFIYVGTENGIFYSIDKELGNIKWKFDTKGNIQSKALVVENLVFFESANIFYALDTTNGKLIWKIDRKIAPEIFEFKERKWIYKLDPYDDIRSTPCYFKGIIYIGTTDGKVLGINSKNGTIVLDLNTNNNSPVRSSPLVKDDIIYFGDWNGVIYAYNLKDNAFNWKKKTYRNKEYITFGCIASGFVIKDSLLIFGARNQILNTLHIKDGQKEWTFSDKDNGWIIGNPIIFNDTLYIGGSDNFSMYAIEPWHGQMLWKHNGGKNIYTKPLIKDNWLIYTSGNAYKYEATGIVYLLNRKNGSEITTFETPNGIFSSPAFIKEDEIVFGCYDGKIRVLKILN
nr:PQQ-binding-like beta-propeller repeat protein [uncultured Psychroserpens sp.]